MRRPSIAVVGIGLEYPDASNPDDLWDNVLAGRRAFREIPAERTSLDDYWNADPAAPDTFYSRKAAVLRDYEFDRLTYKVSAGTFRSTDMTHWLTLDVAHRALADAGFPEAEGMPLERTGVVMGNSLTGEFSRAGLMRLRWPYVRRVVAAELYRREWGQEEADDFIIALERLYKAPFSPVTEDTLAGGLSNTIPGRVCNYFDFGGGGFAVDGACSSSLLAVIQAARGLEDGDLDVALAGGVDLSIDPFEVIGFAKTGALAKREMLVYDEDSNGFWPGEGCGIVVMMRLDDAVAAGHRIYSLISGWGISSDGAGGITRPEESGHRRAIEQAYRRAGYAPGTVGYFEGHGTGTAVGDETELTTFANTREGDGCVPLAVSSIKANIGHTKAAAGVAGLIKASLAVHHEVIPPVTGNRNPHRLADTDWVQLPREPRLWPEGAEVRASVSAMGFGGINTHITLQKYGPRTRSEIDDRTREHTGRQDAELLLFAAEDVEELRAQVAAAHTTLTRAAMCELADLAAGLEPSPSAPLRAAIAAKTPEVAAARLVALRDRLDRLQGEEDAPELTRIEQVAPGCYLGTGEAPARIGLIFPGQGTGEGADGALAARGLGGPIADACPRFEGTGTDAVQPRVVYSSMRAMAALREAGVDGDVAAGHSLGELSAFAWSGALDPVTAVELARERGTIMARTSPPGRTMAAIRTDPERTEQLIDGHDATITGFNAPEVTVIGGPERAVAKVVEEAREDGVQSVPLDVAHAFHTADFEPAAEEFADVVRRTETSPAARCMLSTLTGEPLPAEIEGGLANYLSTQMVNPVQFAPAVERMADCQIVIECGPGRSLTGLAREILPGATALSVDSDNDSLEPFLEALAAAHAGGRALDTGPLRRGRVLRPLEPGQEFAFLANPCEEAPELAYELTEGTVIPGEDGAAQAEEGENTLDVLVRLMAGKAELPLEMVTEGTLPLDELHLSSITVGQVVNETVRALGRAPLSGVPSFATASLGDIAGMLDEADTGEAADAEAIRGASPWVRSFVVAQHPAPAPAPAEDTGGEDGEDGEDDEETAEDLLLDVRGLTPEQFVTACAQVLARAKELTEADREWRLQVVQHAARGAAGLARSLYQEHPARRVVVVTVPEKEDEQLAGRIAAELPGTGFTELTLHADGTRTVPRLEVLPEQAADEQPLLEGGLLVASGGAKGITAEACLALANTYGLALGLLGRAPADDEEVAATLSRAADDGIPASYERCDITDPDAVAEAVGKLREQHGPVTAVLHGAGVNNPKAAISMTEDDLWEALRPKPLGLQHLLAAAGDEDLRLVVGFASIIGRAGLYGEAHYATANDWLSGDLEIFAREHPAVRVRSLEWSVWSGAGMGERLGVVERLQQQGIEPIAAEWGVEALLKQVADPDGPVTTVVASRTGSLPTLTYAPRELDLGRYLEKEIVHYPGVELITEVTLDPATDPYLLEHELDDALLMPAVTGLEGMTQVAASLEPLGRYVTITEAKFERPVVVPKDGSETIRLCAVADGSGAVQLALRAGSTGFVADHFTAVLRPSHEQVQNPCVDSPLSDLPEIELDPQDELYGSMMFQGKRFQKIRGYRVAGARRVEAELDPTPGAPFFAAHLPGTLRLGDPGVRDAMMHALQCCVPNATLLPESVERITVDRERPDGPLTLQAWERSQDGDWYVYDLCARTADGEVREAWRGLRVRAVQHRDPTEIEWPAAFAGAYLQRAAEELLDTEIEIAVEPHAEKPGPVEERRAVTAAALSRAAGRPIEPVYRPDGRPLDPDGQHITASHSDGVTLAAIAGELVTCDVEDVVARDRETWSGLLGDEGMATVDLMLGEGAGADLDEVATRVWGVMECLRKGGHLNTPVQAGTATDDGWVRFEIGPCAAGSWAATLNDGRRTVFTVMKG